MQHQNILCSSQLVMYRLCETNSDTTNSYRQQLKIFHNEVWSASLQENNLSFINKKQTLLDEINGQRLIALARAIAPEENIIDHHTNIQRRLLTQETSKKIRLAVSDNIVDASRTIAFIFSLDLDTRQNVCTKK